MRAFYNFLSTESLSLDQTHFKWIKLLIKNDKNKMKQFREIFNKCNRHMEITTMRYRRYLFEKERSEILLKLMGKTFNNNNIKKLDNFLNKLFSKYMSELLIDHITKI